VGELEEQVKDFSRDERRVSILRFIFSILSSAMKFKSTSISAIMTLGRWYKMTVVLWTGVKFNYAVNIKVSEPCWKVLCIARGLQNFAEDEFV
jgi:hypothetical protein